MIFDFIFLTVFCKECTNYENSKYLRFPVGQLRHNVLITVFSNGCTQYTVDCVYTLVCSIWCYECYCLQRISRCTGHLR